LQKEKNLPVAAGALINDVLAWLPAAQAELKPWDIIVAINEKALSPQLPLLYHIYTYLPGSTVSFSVIRNGETIKVPVILWENGG
jgi:S1-C subfamily serine protease